MAILSSKFWWGVRSFWHAPSSRQSCNKPDTFLRYCTIEKKYYLNPMYRWNLNNPRQLWTLFRCDLKGLLNRLYWSARWHSRICCNGNARGWRTDFCERLEVYARTDEDVEI